MSASNYLENKVIEHCLRNVAYTAPTAVYAALFTVDPGEAGPGTEVSGGAYARQAITFGAASNGVCSNTGAVTFPVATASWGTVTHFGIFDAASAGNMLFSGALTASQAVAINNQIIFNVAQISVSID